MAAEANAENDGFFLGGKQGDGAQNGGTRSRTPVGMRSLNKLDFYGRKKGK